MGPGGQPQERFDVIAARRGGDPEQGMTDEPSLAGSSLEQAVFWQRIYSEILAMEEGVLSRMLDLIKTESPEVRLEAELSNVPVIQAQAARFRVRRNFWSRRVDELNDRERIAAAP